jgi:hypothetical protein
VTNPLLTPYLFTANPDIAFKIPLEALLLAAASTEFEIPFLVPTATPKFSNDKVFNLVFASMSTGGCCGDFAY